MTPRKNILKRSARFALFSLSYLPLFLLLMMKQYLAQVANITRDHQFFWMVWFNTWTNGLFFFTLFFCSVIGILGTAAFIKNMKRFVKNGHPIEIVEVKDKSSESIGYIATYIIPFLFVSFDDCFTVIGISVLLFVICTLYMRSNLIVINPVLNLRYSLYEITFTDGEPTTDGKLKIKNCILLSRAKYIKEEDKLIVTRIGHKLFFGVENDQ